MNKIYKVIWSKARSCYVAVSELANAHSKGGKGSKGARALLASALLLGAGLMPLFTTELDAAYTATGTSKGQYTVYQTDASADNTTTQTWDGKEYTYTKQTLTNPDNKEKVYVYVRDGYTAALVEGKRFSSAEVNYKIMAYQTDMSASTKGLLYTDTVNGTIGSETLTEGGIKDVAVTMYTGGVIGENDTPYNWNYYIQDTDGTWVDGGSMGKNRFVTVTANDQGMYTYNGELLENSYIYVLKKNKTYQIGVFVNDKGHLYKGNVYGKHNEILKTAVDENNNIYSFWGAENDDPNVLLSQSNMTIGELNSALGALVTNVRTAQGDDIQKVTATGSDNSGTISLMRRGQYDATTGKYTGDYAVDGTLQLTSDGGTDGKDVTLHVQQAGTDGTYADAFTLAAGSKVEALGDEGATLSEGGTVKKLKINGISYSLAQDTGTTYTAGENITISDDNKISAKDTTLSTATKTLAADGAVTWTITDTAGESVELTDLASHTDLSNLTTTVNTHYTTLSNNDIKSGSIGTDGKVTLTKNDNNTIEVGTVKDYSVTSGVYNSDGKKITLTKKNAYSDDTATVDIDLTALEKKMGDLTNITTDGKTQITNLIDVKAGDNITSVTSTTDENGVKTFTVNAKDTTYIAGDNITIDKDNNNKISAKDTTLSTATKTTATDGAVTWTITDTDNNSVKLEGLASYADLSALSTTVSTNYTTLSNNDIKSGSISDTGKVTLTKNDNSTIEVGTVKDYSVTSGAYDSANKKITLTKKNAYSEDTATVDIDLTELENKISDSSSTIAKGFSLIGTTEDSKATTKNLGEAITVDGANGIVVSSTDGEDGQVTVSLDSTITIGKADKKGEDGKPGEKGEQGHIGLAGKDGETIKIIDIRAEKGAAGVDGKDGKDGITRIIYKEGEKEHTVATLDDGLKFAGDSGNTITKNLNETLTIQGGATGTLTGGNIGVISDGGVLTVKLANALNDITSITGNGTTISLNSGSVSINGGLNVSGKITGVTAGEADTDAVNVSQLNAVKADISTLDSGAVKYDKNGDTYDYSKVTMGGAAGTAYNAETKAGGTTITNVSYATVTDKTAAGYDGSQAVNMDRLNDSITDLTNNGFSLLGTADGSKATTKKLGEAITVDGANGIVVSSTEGDDGKVTVSLANTITVGKDGKDGADGEQGHIGLAGKDGETIKIIDIRAEKGAAGVDGKDGKDGITRIIYKEGEKEHTVATLDDGLKFAGDSGDTIAKKLNDILTIQGGATGTLTDNNIGVISDGGVLKVKLANALNSITSISNGTTSIELNNGVTIKGGEVNVSNNKITNVANGTDDSDAVNKGQLDEAIKDAQTTLTTKGFALEDETGNKVEKNLGEAIKVVGENGINVNASNTDGKVTVSLDSNITVGKDGKDGTTVEQGHIGLAGKDGTNGKDGTTLVDIRTETGKPGLDGKDGEDGITRIIYEDGKGDHQVATLDDGLKFQGDDSTVISKALNSTMEIKGGADTSKLTEGNIGVISDDGVLKVKLANALNGITSITNDKTSITLNDQGGVTIEGGDVNVSNNKITGVTAGEADTDAVNVSQLNAVKADISTLDSGAVKYDKNGDTYDYSKVTMGGTTYTTDKTGGTIITNVAYSTGNKSDAVNVQYLEDKIAASQGSMTAAEKHIKEGTYTVVDDKVTMEQVNGEGTKTGEVIITDVAKASELGKLNSNTETHEEKKEDGILKDSLKNTEKDDQGNTKTTTMADVANKLDDKIDDVSGKVTTLEKTVETYQTTTNEKLTKIEQSIVDANANHTALTVNGGEAATADGNQKGNLQLKVTTENGKSTYDVKLSDKVVLGDEKSGITLDGTEGEATISKKLTVGDSESGITMQKLDLGTYTKDVGEHKKGDALKGYSVTGLGNTTTHYEQFADGTGKAATEEQLKEALGAMDFQATDTKDGETVNKYNIVNNATNVTEAIYAIDQNLTDANARIENNAINIQNLSGSLGKLNTRVNRVGAGAAALAALHPLDFDPDDKWDFAAGYGNYAGANATSIGAYYRPNEDTMFSVAGSFGGGENMVNAGVSFKLGQGNHVTTSRVAMAKEIKALRATVEEQSEQNAALSATVEAQGKQIAALTALVEKLTGEKVETPDAEKKDA